MSKSTKSELKVLNYCNKHGHSAFQTLHGFGFLCRFCGVIINYCPWPEGYDIRAVPDWNMSPEDLMEKMFK